jgi:hypothetical protein
MTTLTILIIRHGEKLGEAHPGPGLAIKGRADEHSLAIRGWQRDGALASRFGSVGNQTYPRPDFVSAANLLAAVKTRAHPAAGSF